MTRCVLIAALVILAAALTGCGGGGGGGARTTSIGVLSAEMPEVTGRSGQSVLVPVTVTGSSDVSTATFDVVFSDGAFAPASGAVGGDSVDISGGSPDCVCRCKWVDEQTMRVMYASSTGTEPGGVLCNLPVLVQSETGADVDLESVVVNQ